MRSTIRQRDTKMRVLIALQDVDCTIERGQLDPGAAGVKRPEQAVVELRIEMLLMRGRRQLRFVNHFSLERSGAEVERIAGGKAHFDYAAVVLQFVHAIRQEFAAEKDVAFGGLRAHLIAAEIHKPEIAAD